jgi:broad-specificity NMP kinase
MDNKNYYLTEKQEMSFPNVASRISYYYEEMFKINIMGLFYKKNLDKDLKKLISDCNYLKIMEYGEFDFYVLIKDNNKKFIKYRLLKCTYNSDKIKENLKEMSFLDMIYFFVDEKIGDYCNEKYIKKYNNKQINDLILKNQEINNNYCNWNMNIHNNSNINKQK